MRRTDIATIRQLLLCAGSVLLLSGCSESPPETTSQSAPPVKVATAQDAPRPLTASELRQRLGTDERATFRRVGSEIVEARLAGAGVRSIAALQGLRLRLLDLGFCEAVDDISVVQGMPLTTLILEGTSVASLAPVQGMSLEVLHLQDTPITDLSPIMGMPLRQLNLKGVAVSDTSLFAEMPLEILWLPGTQVTDIGPLRDASLMSLDVQSTGVVDLSPLQEMQTLRRLNIAETPVTDLRPLAQLSLQRILLSPKRITQGMEQLRAMASLETIGTSFRDQLPRDRFWELYDGGTWSEANSGDDDAAAAAPEEDSSDVEPDTGQPDGGPETSGDN